MHKRTNAAHTFAQYAVYSTTSSAPYWKSLFVRRRRTSSVRSFFDAAASRVARAALGRSERWLVQGALLN